MTGRGPGLGVVAVLAAKDIRLLTRDRVALFFTLVFPLLFGVLFGAVFSGSATGQGPRSLPVAIADLDQSEDSRAVIGRLGGDARIEARPVETREAASEMVRTGQAEAYFVFPAGFGDAAAMPFAGRPMRLEIGSAPGGRATRGLLTGVATRALYEHLQMGMLDAERSRAMIREARAMLGEAEGVEPGRRLALQGLLAAADRVVMSTPTVEAEDDGAGGGAGFELIDIDEVEVTARDEAVTVSSYAISFPQAMLWGVMGCAAVFGVSLVGERTGGTLTRLRVAPIGRWHIVLGKAVACLAMTLLVCVVMLAVAWLGFGVRPVAPATLAVAVLAVAFCFVGVMMLLSVVARTEAAASGIGWACLLTLAMIGGGAIPLAFMPPWLRQVGHVSPVKWGIVAIEGGLWRGLSPGEMLLPVGLLLGIGLGTFAIGAAIFARRENR
ncbi:MAG: ABC transporter permease [Phycisphaerales bacterium JB060]